MSVDVKDPKVRAVGVDDCNGRHCQYRRRSVERHHLMREENDRLIVAPW
jgi:hypothetical protein